MDQTPSEICAVAWVRAVRDAMYEETKGMDAGEFAAYVARKAASVRAEDAARRPSSGPATERSVEAAETGRSSAAAARHSAAGSAA